MTDIMAKLEAAKEGSRVLDAEIVAHSIGAIVKPYPPTDGFGPKCRWQFWSVDGKHFLGNETKYPVLHYTTSIDAALTLVPEYENMSGTEMLSMDWGVGTLSSDNNPRFHFCANVRRKGITGNEPPYDAGAATPALALCIAALRARAGM